MAERIPQSVAYLVVFRAFLASDGKTPATGKTIAITLSKNGATSFSNPNAGATNATEMASGFYKFTLDTTDTGTAGPLAWRGAEASINDAGDVLTVASAHNAGFDGVANATAGAANGLMISGSNTGPWSVSGGVTFSNSGGDGFTCTSSGSNGNGITASANGSGSGFRSTGGTSGRGMRLDGGSSSGVAMALFTTSGDGLTIVPTGGNAITATGSGDTTHGLSLLGGGANGHGLLAQGGGANAGSAAGHGIRSQGGAASTTSGGAAGSGLRAVGGSGSSSTNGAGEGVTAVGGGTTTVAGANGLSATGTGNLNGAAFVHAGTGQDFLATLVAANFGSASLNGKGDWNTTTPPTTAQIATAVWTDTTGSDFTTAHSIGKCLFIDNIAPGAANGLALVGSNVGAATSVSGAVGSVTGNVGGSVASVTAGVTVATNNDKTGYSLAATGLDAIAVTDPGAASNHTTLAKMLVATWRALWRKDTMTSSQWKRYADDGTTVNSTSALSDDNITQTRGSFN